MNDVKILSSLSYEGRLVGYDMTYDENAVDLLTVELPILEKVFYWIMAQQKLEYFHELGIVFGDVKSNNILINPKKKSLSFCDLDNIQMGNYPMDCCSDYLISFADDDGFVPEEVDRYMYNLMLLSELEQTSKGYDEVLGLLELGYQFPYLKETAQPILREMRKASYSFKGDYLTKHLNLKI